jgi:hypothetical protein
MCACRSSCSAVLVVAMGVGSGLGLAGRVHGQIRVGEWNVTNFSAGSVAGRGSAFATALYGTAPNGLRFAPDILLIQEVEQGGFPPSGDQATGQASVNAFLGILNSAPGSPGDWAAAPYVVNAGDDGNAMLYRTSKVQYLDVVTLNAGTGSGATQPPRDTQRWRVRLVGYSSPSTELYMYGCHFKAGNTAADQTRRNPDAQRMRDNANALPANARFLVGADFNIQGSSQLAYQYMVGFGVFPAGDPRNVLSGRFVDPINAPGTWNNNGTFRFIHTQEPATMMDDRHDQILVSSSLMQQSGLAYIYVSANPNVPTPSPFSAVTWNDPNHSYRCWGNDGSTYNLPINTTNNAQVGNSIASALITTVTGGGGAGHLPVYLDLQVPAKLGAPVAAIDFGTVPINGTAQVVINISNAADVPRFSRVAGAAAGIEPLRYSFAASSGFAVPGTTFSVPATVAPALSNTHVISMNTSVSGTFNGTLTITSNDPDVPTRVIALTGVVGGGGPTTPPPGNYDVNGDGVINDDDIYAWFGLFTDVDNSGAVDAADLAFLQRGIRWNERWDITQGRR